MVTVASRAIHTFAGLLGGLLIPVDYFLTAGLSALSELRNPATFWAGLGKLPTVSWPPGGCREALQTLLPAGETKPILRRRRAGLGSLGHPRVVAIAD